jgi:hypothetical protein
MLSSAYWGFDLFRAVKKQRELVWIWAPYPVPMALVTHDVARYTLVAYDAEDRVSAMESGLSLHLRAGDLMFYIDPDGAREGEANLLVAPARRDAYLRDARWSSGCTVVFGLGARADEWAAWLRVSVDAGPDRRLPLGVSAAHWQKSDERERWLGGVEPGPTDLGYPLLQTLVPLRLAAGEHVLALWVHPYKGGTSFKLACTPGEVVYLAIEVSRREEGRWFPEFVDWRIARSETLDERFARRAFVVLADDRWYAEAEPARYAARRDGRMGVAPGSGSMQDGRPATGWANPGRS